MTFDEWFCKRWPVCESGKHVYAESLMREAWDNRQARIDAHNRKCVEDCKREMTIRCCDEFGYSSKGRMCDACPRQYLIEE